MNKRWTAVAVAAAVLLGHAFAVATGSVAIAGKITNGTLGQSAPGGIEVTAAQISGSGQEKDRRHITAAADGTFRIEGFDPALANHYVVATTFKGVTYSTVVDGDGGPEVQVELKVFETTEDDSGVKAVSDSLTVVKGKQDTFEVLQMFKISNLSDRTFVGRSADDSPAVVRLPVAQGGFDLSPGEGISRDRITTTAEGLGITDPLQPGESTFSYAYKVRIPRTGWPLSRQIVYPTDHFDLLVGQGLKVVFPTLHFAESRDLGGKHFSRYRGGPFTAGSLVEGDVTESGRVTASLRIGLIALFIAIMIGGFLFLRSSKRDPAEPSDGADGTDGADRERLIEDIARLDERFASGQIAEDEYRSSRQTKKELLLTMGGEEVHAK